MKTKICFIAIFLLGIYYITQAQTMNNAVWTEYRINFQYTPFVESKYQYWIDGDTIINAQTYKKVVSNPKPWLVGDDGYVGAIREDNGKVYAIPFYPSVNDEFLLYDYTVQVGDVITSTAPEGVLSYPLTVAQVDEITVENGEQRKRIFLDYQIVWIEGIGSTNGLFNDAMWHSANFTSLRLVCFKQDDETLYRDAEWCQSNNCCADIGTDIPTTSTFWDSETILTQNNNQITLDFPEVFTGKTTIRLFDATGCFLFEEMTIQKSFEKDISNLSKGIYLISIQNGNNVEYIKLIKLKS